MEPAFAEAVDQAFVAALELLERVSVGETKTPAEERSRLKGWIDRAEAMVSGGEEWELAKYALVGWFDSALTAAPWDGAAFWSDNPLEREYYFERRAFTEFFRKADQAAQLKRKNALEVYYLCVVFGFRGLYGPDPETRVEGERPEDLNLPADIETWAKQVAAQLRIDASRAPLYPEPKPLDGAPPLDGKRTLVMSLAVAAVFVAVPAGLLIVHLLQPS